MICRVIRVGRDHVTLEVELPDGATPPPEILDRLDRMAGLTPVTAAAAAVHPAAGATSAGRVMGARTASPAPPQGQTAVDTILAREYPPDA